MAGNRYTVDPRYGEHDSVHYTLRLTPAQADELTRRADKEGMTRAAYVRKELFGDEPE